MEFTSSKYFQKKFNKLSFKLQNQVAKRLELFRINQFHPLLKNHQLHGEFKDLRSINITADVRLLYEKISNNVYKLSDIGTHSELYG